MKIPKITTLTIAVVALLAVALAACGDEEAIAPTPPTSTYAITAEEYRETTFVLFDELQSMVADGNLDPRGPDLGFSPGNPRALRWSRNVEAVLDKGGTFQEGLSFEEQCFKLSDGSGDFVCGAELISFVTAIVGDHWNEYQELVDKFTRAKKLSGR